MDQLGGPPLPSAYISSAYRGPPLDIISLKYKRGPPLDIISLKYKREPPLEIIGLKYKWPTA
jgi:hypothetical protein